MIDLASSIYRTIPRVWAGCLHCYNSSRLVGCWVDCTEAEEATLELIHSEIGGPFVGCEEIWCFDTDFIPRPHEMGLSEAQRWGDLFDDVGEDQWAALCAWVRSGSYETEDNTPFPDVRAFQDKYRGHWNSFEDYAQDLVDNTGMMYGWPEEAVQYFNWDSWTEDLRQDYTVLDTPDWDLGVYVFQS